MRAIRRAPAVFALIAAILIVFAAEILEGVSIVAVGPADLPILDRMGAINSSIFFHDQYWRLFTAMFLHVGLLHLLLNVWALYQLGYIFELIFGSGRFVFTYFLSGIAASLASASFIGPFGISAGASGAVFGILGALILALRRSPLYRYEPWVRGLMRQLITWAVINVIIGFTIPHIDNAAHIGGFVAGLITGLLPHRLPPRPPGEVIIDATPTATAREER